MDPPGRGNQQAGVLGIPGLSRKQRSLRITEFVGGQSIPPDRTFSSASWANSRFTSAARVRLQVAPVAPWWATRTDGTDQQLYLGMAVRNKSSKA